MEQFHFKIINILFFRSHLFWGGFPSTSYQEGLPGKTQDTLAYFSHMAWDVSGCPLRARGKGRERESRLLTAPVTQLYVCTVIPSGHLYRAQCQSGLRLLINVELNQWKKKIFWL